MPVKPTARIYDVIRNISNDEFLLPSIQRSFVWGEDKICKLFDSLMNDYPIGSCLIWSRKFIKDYKSQKSLLPSEIEVSKSSYLVLDGQQRLQSLYLGFFGSYDGEKLYFNADSNPTEEENDLAYQFQLMLPVKAKEDLHWMLPEEIIGLDIEDIQEFVDRNFRDNTVENRKRITKNLSKFIKVFNIEERIFLQEVKETLPYNDVLEVFVRVNSGGMVLKKSDLVFSTVKLHMPDMEEKFIELIDKLNGGGEFDFDIDFIIKTSFVLFDKWAKYDVGKLKDNDYINKLKNNFNNLRKTLLSTKEFIKSDAKMLSRRFLKSDLAVIPIINYIFQQPHQHLPEGQSKSIRQYLYMSFFMKFYSHGSDGKLDALHKKTIKQSFPIEEISKYMADKTGMNYGFSKAMLSDVDLILNIIQGGVYEIPKSRGWSLEKDHIFPQSILRQKNIPDELINSVGNLRLINKTRNILKSDTPPPRDIEFFGVEEKIYSILEKEFCKDYYQEKVSHGVPRWKHHIAFAKERARQIHGFIKSPKESGRGYWELTTKGWEKYYTLKKET
ncbi:MAG: DUF262 domain-containing protein [Nitrospirae bacterium]|nr:DUF262 domain-containing protein [Nitrospirota bacterium]